MKDQVLKKKLRERMKKDSGFLVTAYPQLYRETINKMIEPFNKKDFDKIMSPEMKGMFFGPTIAYKWNLPFISIIKKGRVPEEFVLSKSYVDYSKKRKTLQIAKITINKGDKIFLVDDVFDSGESGKAIIEMIEKLGGEVKGISIIYNKMTKEEENFFNKYNFNYLVRMKKGG